MEQTSAEQMDGRDSRGRFAKGNKAAARHYGHTYIATSNLPPIRGIRKMKKSLEKMRRELEDTIPDMNAKKAILVDQVVKSAGFMWLFEIYCRKAGLLDPALSKKGRLDFQPGMKIYLSMLNSQRAALVALGIDQIKGDKILSPIEIIEQEKGGKDGKNSNDK